MNMSATIAASPPPGSGSALADLPPATLAETARSNDPLASGAALATLDTFTGSRGGTDSLVRGDDGPVTVAQVILQPDRGLSSRDYGGSDSFGRPIDVDSRYRTTMRGDIVEIQAAGDLQAGAAASVQVEGQRSRYVVTIHRDGGAVNLLNPQNMFQRLSEFLNFSARGNIRITDLPVPRQNEGMIQFTRELRGTEWNGDSGSSIQDLNTVDSRQTIRVYTREYFNYLQEVQSYRSFGLPPTGGTVQPRGIQYDDLSITPPPLPPLVDPRGPQNNPGSR